jgi:hypothetical protein
MKLKLHQPKLKIHTLNPNQTKNLVEDDEHNPHVKTLVLNWHNQNPNTTTVEKLKVLLKQLYSNVFSQ